MAFAIYLTYLFTIGAFDLHPEKWKKNFVLIFGIVTVSYLMIFFTYGETMLDLIGFLLIVIYLGIVFVPYMLKSFSYMKAVDNPGSKRGFLYLGLSSTAYILVFVSFLIDRVLVVMNDSGFTFFYFSAWTFGVFSISFAFLGYIRPGK
jgi:hypothetical protein